jgi:hypothetical protein
MKLNMSASVGSLYEGEIKDYATLGGFILFQKPDSIRIRGLDPVMHITVFDMVSAGDKFRIYIPSKNQFIEGINSVPVSSNNKSNNKLETLRPVAFLTSLIRRQTSRSLRRIQPAARQLISYCSSGATQTTGSSVAFILTVIICKS